MFNEKGVPQLCIQNKRFQNFLDRDIEERSSTIHEMTKLFIGKYKSHYNGIRILKDGTTLSI